MGFLIFFLLLAALYFLPTIIAIWRGKRNKGAIFALNLFLGWTLLGWVISLVWSLTHDGLVVISKNETIAGVQETSDIGREI